VDAVGELEDKDHAQAQEVAASPNAFRRITEVKVASTKLDSLVDLVAEMLVAKLQLDTVWQGKAGEKASDVASSLARQGNLMRELQYQVLQLRMTPLRQVFNRFPRMVRDLATAEEKDVEFAVSGGDIELDRGILDELGEPLVHLLRNAVDHGIAEKGTITLDAFRREDQVVITIANDGEIEWKKVMAKFHELHPGQQLAGDEDAVHQKALFSGLSTAEHVTEISGRGVGLSVARETIESLGGNIRGDSKGGTTTFTITLPLSVAIVEALIISVQQQLFAVPISVVDRLMHASDISEHTQADQGVTVVDGTEVPLLGLADVLQVMHAEERPEAFAVESGVAPQQASAAGQIVLLVGVNERRVGFRVDEVVSRQDIIVKPLDLGVAKEHGTYSGVTILGDGEPVPILDVSSLLEWTDEMTMQQAA